MNNINIFKQKIDSFKSIIKNIPESPGIYFFKDSNDNIIYIGKSKNLKKRLQQHLLNSIDLIINSEKIEYNVLSTELEALITESVLIYKYKPYYNIQFKYKKPIKYIVLVNKDGIPYFDISSNLNENISFFLGPFLNIYNFNNLVKILGSLFGIRICRYDFRKNRPNLCIYYDLKMCSGICQFKIDLNDYLENVSKAISFLKKNKNELDIYLNQLYKEMYEYKEKLEYEKAILIRDKIKTIERYLANFFNQDEMYLVYINPSFIQNNNLLITLSSIFSNDLTNIIRDTQIINLKVENFYISNNFELAKFIFFVIFQNIPNTNTKKKILVNYAYDELVEVFNNIKQGNFEVFNNLNLKSELIQRSFNIDIIKLDELNFDYDHIFKYLDNMIKEFYLKDQKLKMEQLLNDLSKLLNITNIYRIETIDISHFYGQNVYGSLIVFENNSLKKDKYRIFKLHYSFDDLSNIKELLQRRIKYILYSEKYKDKSLNIFPQLIIIDGGKNQLKVANNVINKHFQHLIKVISIVKPEDKILFYLDDKIRELNLKDINIDLWNFIRMLRDEAHNFANKKRISYSKLIP